MPGSNKSRCCRTLLILLALLLLAAVGGVLVWYFLPDDTKSGLQDSLNDTVPSAPTVSPGTDAPTFDFDVCSNPFDCCNGADICDLPVNDVLFATPHNSMSSLENGFLVGYNHEESLEKALERGYRGLNLDIGKCNGEYKFIHGLCFAGNRNPGEVVRAIDAFLDDNPNEVLLITLQIDNDADGVVDYSEVYDIMAGANGFVNRLYAHDTTATEWPTLQTLIDNDTRIVLFYFNGPGCDQVACPPGWHEWFDYATETEFSFENVAAFDDTAYACALERGADGPRDFFGVNVFVSNPLPSKSAAQTLNQYEFLQVHLEACTNLNNGLNPNVLAVDFWSQGDAVQVVQLHNNALGQARRRRLRSTTNHFSRRNE